MKHVLVTGGSDGLGRVTAQKLVGAGFRVTILSRDMENTETAAAEINCQYVVADVTDAQQVERAIADAVKQNGEVDILINNAGVWIFGILESNKPNEIERAIAVNTLGAIYCTRAVVTSMKARKSGRIINVNSQAGLDGRPERAVYNASKWAITGFTKCLQLELKPFKIAVSGIYPGGMATNLFAKAGDMKQRIGLLDPVFAAEQLVNICQLPDNVTMPEVGIESLDY